MLLGLVCYLLNYVMGRTRNQSLAVAWWVLHTTVHKKTVVVKTLAN